MYQPRLSLSSVLGGLFSRGVDSAPHSRENGWSPGGPVPCFMQIKSKLIANKTPPGTWCMLEALVVLSKPWVDACWWWGSINFTILFWNHLYCMYHGRYQDLLVFMLIIKACRSKYYLSLFQKTSSGTSTNPCFPLRRAYLFTFMLSHHPSY